MKQNFTPSSKLGQWLGYSGMATAFLAIATKADAQVVHTDIDPDAVLVNDNMDIDFDGDGIADLNMSQAGYSSSGFTQNYDLVNIPSGNAVIGSLDGDYIYPYALASGAPIAPDDANFQSGSFASLFYGSASFAFGNWGGQTGFLGCRFVGGDGETHYGWVQLTIPTNGASITIMDYGYETMPDVAINAGDVGMTTGIVADNARTFNMDVTPNPTTDNAVIRFPNSGSGHMRMSVLNGVGETFLNEQLGNADSYTLNMADYAPGVYFVRLQDDKKVAFRKVVKQ